MFLKVIESQYWHITVIDTLNFYTQYLGRSNIRPINTRLAPPEIEFWINDSESKVLFVDKNFAEVVINLKEENKIPSVKNIVYLSDDACPNNMINYEDLITMKPQRIL